MTDYEKTWRVTNNWNYRFPNNKDNFSAEKETKIFISIDLSDIYKAINIFKDFMDRYDLYGKTPSIFGNKKISNRNTLIIYSALKKEMLLELELEFYKKGIKPKLIKSGSRIPDIAIKGSLYFYFKSDRLKNNAYNNKKQVKLMDKIRNTTKYDNIKIIKYYKEIDLTENTPIEKFKNYSKNKKYFIYLEILKNCNAVQRQILDAFFRNELKMCNNNIIGWYKFNPEFIENRLQLIKFFVENTKNIPESELRKFLNYFVIGGYVGEDPTMTENGFYFIQNIKAYLKSGNIKNVEDEFNKIYFILNVNKQLSTKKIKNDFISEIKEYYTNADFYDLAFGNFALKHLNFIIDDFYNYHKEMNFVINRDLEQAKELLDIEKIESGIGNTLEERYKNYYENIIIPNISQILNVIEKYKNIIAIRTAENEYNLFIEKYSLKLQSILTDQLKQTIKEALYKLFSYDSNIEEKIEAKKILQYNLYNIKKHYKFTKKIGKINKYKYFEYAKSFLMWNGIIGIKNNSKFLENIDAYRRRYIKYNNIKYNNLEEGGLITSVLEKSMIFVRGLNISDKTANKFLNIGMDGEYIDYVTISDYNIIKNNSLHKGLISVTTDINIANKYVLENNKSKIFLISVPDGTKVLNPVFSDSRAYEYSELDLVSIPAEWIIGYFKVSKNYKNEKEYFFKKNPSFKNENLSKKFYFKNGANFNLILKDEIKYSNYNINCILSASDFERRRMQRENNFKMINMIRNVSNFFNLNEIKNIVLRDFLNLFKDKNFKEYIEIVLENINANNLLYQDNNEFNPFCNILRNGRIYHFVAHIYNNYSKLREKEEIEIKNYVNSKGINLRNIDFSDKDHKIILYFARLYEEANSLLRKKNKLYFIIADIIMDGVLEILLNKYKINEINVTEQNNSFMDSYFDVKNSLKLLKIVENEIDDIKNMTIPKRNSELQRKKMSNIINHNFKNYNYNDDYDSMDMDKKREIFLNIVDANNYCMYKSKHILEKF